MAELDEDKIIEPRFRTRNKKSAFQKTLERLKRRKLGQSSRSSSDDDENDDDNDESGGFVRPFKGAKPHQEGQSSEDESEGGDEEEEEEDTGFVVEDDPNQAATALPVMFSMDTHQDLSHHFKIICQLFVHLAVQPPKKRKDFMEAVNTSEEYQYFLVPLQIARRKLSGMKDSLVASSVWRSDFKKPLERYSEISIVPLEFAVPHCDACRLGARISTLCCRIHGVAYNKQTYEPLGPSASGSESDDSDDSDIEEVPDENVVRAEFNLGRFCARRTRVFHQFNHWEFALYKALEAEIITAKDGRDRNGFVTVAFAGGLKPPDDLSDADAIMDWLDQRHIISMEWQKLKQMMDSARNLEIAAKKGDDMD
ncbi:hypothetical protein PUNSTDRAFT_89577 [Punctularia strigosozonata HHB-11173 SS5]|uniref:uncharacterized protein n=1 Tax=Punctularia strigosozonata (strain HHB-11173) TaxID=741275 RepID=UPI0004417ACC|nr:uncharacterized protein PUNSTDRAFT_89577 [Punctularia strigosozonata HHB-11173 SS5]EIN07339.1 hypothetical protein PUNSTDRAFT_89577 [Punctularia strigosozonata HHB-11173 SS5]